MQILVPGKFLIPFLNGADLLIYNDSDDFVSVMDGTFVGFQMNFGRWILLLQVTSLLNLLSKTL